MSAALIQGVKGAELDFLQQSLDKAEENLAEVKLLAAIAQDATATEIEARNQSLINIRAARQRSLSVSGDVCQQ